MKINEIIVEGGFWDAVSRGAAEASNIKLPAKNTAIPAKKNIAQTAVSTDQPHVDSNSQQAAEPKYHQIQTPAGGLSLEEPEVTNTDPDIKVNNRDPAVIKYKNRDYMLNNRGEWADTLKPNGVISPTLQARFNTALDNSLGLAKSVGGTPTPSANGMHPHMPVLSKPKPFTNTEDVYKAKATDVPPPGWVKVINPVDSSLRVIHSSHLTGWLADGWKNAQQPPKPKVTLAQAQATRKPPPAQSTESRSMQRKKL